MKNKYKLMAGAVAVLVGISASVQATTITGGISFAGGFSLPSGNLDTATSITFAPNSDFVTTGTGSFAGITPGTFVTMFSPLNINPTTPPVTALWSVGGFTFNDVTLVESGKDAAGVGTTLTLTGLGNIINGSGGTAVAQYVATFNTLSGTFSFSASSGTVPDGGSTVMLLGAAMSGFALLRKKLMA